uniref:Uncharacterized protein n=1 Tax=Arundo donax TaxID=35708 RepID=A0A0A8ZLK4_ARUDO
MGFQNINRHPYLKIWSPRPILGIHIHLLWSTHLICKLHSPLLVHETKCEVIDLHPHRQFVKNES